MVDIASLAENVGLGDFEPTNCGQCNKPFANSKLLAQHMQVFHSEKAFVCEICGKAFRFRSNLAEHRSVHTALKPFVCRFCGKSSRLKGNLTKHILKHHKAESEGMIGKDDIIVQKDSSTAELIGKMVLKGKQEANPVPSMLPKDEINDYPERFLMSFGLDAGSLDLSAMDKSSESPENGSYSISENMSTSPVPHHTTTVGGETSLQALLATVATPPPTSTPATTASASPAPSIQSSNAGKTQCPQCGKHFRKSSALQVHLTLNHGFPPPGSASSEHSGDGETESVKEVREEVGAIRQSVDALRETSAARSSDKVEQAISALDSRVARLEQQIEMALNSIYTLVQLQNGGGRKDEVKMNS